MTNDTGSPLILIQRLQSALSTSFTERTVPAFDPRVLNSAHKLPSLQANIIQRVSSWSLPKDISTEITALLVDESSKCQTLVHNARAEVLGQLIKTSVTPDPSVIPALVESMCNAVYQSAVDKMLSDVQREVEVFTLRDGDGESEYDSDSISESDGGAESDEDDSLEELDGEEDDAPMKPGEEVPPLETKYLPIFEALHERGKVLTKPEKTYLVNMTGMTYRQITIWNRRRGELKESMNMAASYSKTSSTHSDELSESEQELENVLGPYPPNTTFDIRSWRLQSALATKGDNRGSFPPPSPFKSGFPSFASTIDTESDTDDSDDSDDNISAPPGLQIPSLTTSMATVDSVSTNSTSASVAGGPAFQPSATTSSASKEIAHTRPIRGLPSSRRGSPLTQQTQHLFSHSLNTQNTIPQHQSHQPSDPAHSPLQSVTSNESGLTVNLSAASQMQTTTLRSSPVSAPTAPLGALVPGASSVSPSPPPASAVSPQRQPSPNSNISPRPHIKPLPRRTGCAPRPRPPPRSGPSATPAPTTAPGSSRPSVILPPSSNPSLGNTTLGALLRPNPPAPPIPQDIEERLTAMAGRMGVGANVGSTSNTRQNISSNSSRGGAPGNSAFPSRNGPFSFGPMSLPKTIVPSGARPVPDQPTQGLD